MIMRINPEHIESLRLEDDADFEAMLNESQKSIDGGKIQEGIVVRVDNEYAMIAVSCAKQEGRLPISEIQDSEGNLLFKAGDKIDVYVSLNNERLSVSHKKVLKTRKLEEKIQEIKNNFEGLVVSCKILKKNRGGYIVEFDGVDAFLPRREAMLKEDARNIGKMIKAEVIGVDLEEKSIVVSRRKYLEVMNKNREEILQRLMSAQEALDANVVKITSFGMFVEVEGLEGLVHYTEISHRGPVNPANFAKVGDRVSVKILGYDEEKRRLSFSIKAATEDPWGEIQDKLEVGDTIRVEVSKVEDYGAFVDLGNGTEGFLHISEISWDKQLKHPSDVLKEGQSIDVEIIKIDSDNKRLRVSLKKLMPKPFDQFIKRVKTEDVLEGRVVSLMDFGVFVNLGEVDGLLHNEDISWDKSKKAKDFAIGDVLKVKVIKIDEENEKVSLSLKALVESPVDRFAKDHDIDSIIKGKIVDIKDFGVFVSLQDGVEALIRDEDLYPFKREELKVGDEIEGAIAHIDQRNSRIRLSCRRLDRIKERERLNQYNSDNKMTLGDILKHKK